MAAPLRVAFVGQGVFFSQCVLESEVDGVEPHLLDFRAGAAAEPLLARLLELDPDVVLVFRPEIIPKGLFATLGATRIGYLTEPLPRRPGAPSRRRHLWRPGGPRPEQDDLRQRMWWLRQLDAGNFDRIISFDPLIADTAATVMPVWRSLPIPVADSLFIEPRVRQHPPSLLFVGRSTEHREQMLAPVKRAHPIVHIGHGLFGEPLLRLLRSTDVQLNLHNHPYPTFENRVCLALAAGHLVISEPLSPQHGLEPGVHYLEASTAEQLLALIEELAADPEAYSDVQRAGHAEAERFRASRVYPELLREAAAQPAPEPNGARRASDT